MTPLSCRALCAGHQVIACYAGHFQLQALFGDDGAQGCGAGFGVDPAGIGYHLDAALCDQRQVGLHRRADKIQGVAPAVVLGPGAGHDRHGDLREVIVDDVIQPVRVEQLWRGPGGVTPETAGAAYAQYLVSHQKFS